MFKRITSFVIIIAFLLSFLPAYSIGILNDIDEHWSEAYVEPLFDMGIVKGSFSNFNPEQNITRGEFISLISRSIFNLTNYTPNHYFPDVNSNHIFFSEISIAKENGIIIGKQNGYLGENENITREEAVIIISRIFNNHFSSKSYSFLDILSNYTYKKELDKAVNLGIIEGKPNGKFEPYSLLKRSEGAKILIKILNLYGEKDSESTVLSVASKYLENPDLNIISRAKEDEEFKKNYIKYANSLGVYVDKSIENVKINIENFTSNIATLTAKYDVTFTTTYQDGEKKIKTYNGRCILHLLRKNGDWKIYRADENFFIKDKVNLTWEVFINPPSYAPYGVNVISPTWFELTEDNSYKNLHHVYSDSSLNLYLTDKSTQKYVDFAKNNGYDLWIAYRNDFNKHNTEKFLKNEYSKEKALKLVIEGVLKNKAEGINLDFENMTNKSDYSRHVREVVLASHALGLIVSVDITKYEKTSLSWSMCFDRDYIGKICDYTALMAYDEYGSHSSSSGSTASLSWVENSIKTTLNEVENKKLILGIPFYVRYWQEKNGKIIKTSAISMERANEIIKENNAKKVIKDGQYVATWQKDGFTFSIYLEDEFSVKNRVNLANKYNLSGVASWRRGFETENIWQTIKDILQ